MEKFGSDFDEMWTSLDKCGLDPDQIWISSDWIWIELGPSLNNFEQVSLEMLSIISPRGEINLTFTPQL